MRVCVCVTYFGPYQRPVLENTRYLVRKRKGRVVVQIYKRIHTGQDNISIITKLFPFKNNY